MRIALVLLALVVAAPAEAGVRVVAPFDPADYADRAAVGLLVPGAGPTVTREAALAALLRGKLEHDLLGGIAPGETLIELGAAAGPEILVSLPPPGRSENDTRYPIALLGERGLLTSDSTRIDGLVSITDVATGRLRVVPNDDPVEALETLDDRIDRNDRLRLPLTIALAALLIGLALVRPQLALRALLVALAANLWLDPTIAIAAGVAAIALPLGLACTAILARTSSRWGSIAETVALSPFGPSQSGRFYGVNNLLETMLLVPSLVGAALLGRAGVIVGALAFVTIGGARFGADGGGIVVLAAAYLVLFLRLRDRRPTLQLAAAVAAGAVALALLLLAVDAATGGSSHVTDAVGDGPFALAGDIADRVELSVRRTAASLGATVVVLGSLATLVARGSPRQTRRRAGRVPRRPCGLTRGQRHARRCPRHGGGDRDRTCPALAPAGRVKLSVDAPRRHVARSARPDRPPGRRRRLRRRRGGDSPTPETVEGTLPAATTTEATTTEGAGSELTGDPANGEKVFASAGCGGCHTLEAAGSSGNVGPNLDDAKPDLALALNRVTNGSGAMPSFKGQLSDQEIADVAAYVVESTQG